MLTRQIPIAFQSASFEIMHCHFLIHFKNIKLNNLEMDAIYEVGESQEEQESTRRTDVSNVNAHKSSTS